MTARFRDKVHAITRRVYRLGTVFQFGANTTRSMTSPIGGSRGGGGGGAEGALPPPPPHPPIVKNHGAWPPPLISGNKKNMKDIINSREFQGDKGPDWLKTFHPRDVPNSSRSYCKILEITNIINKYNQKKHDITVKNSTVGSLCNNMGIPALQVYISEHICPRSGF